LHESDGSSAWRLPYAGPALAAPLVWDNGWLVTADTAGTVTAFRASDGHEIWRRNTGSQANAPPALAADRVYVSSADGRLIALRVDTGEPVWEHRLGGPPNDVLALDDRIYVGSNDNFFYCMDTAKGAIIWKWQTGDDVIGRPALDDKRVYFVSLDNVLRALDRKSGAQLWKRALPMRPTGGPLLAGNTLIVSGLEPTPRAYLTKDGSPGSDLQVAGVVAAPPRIVTVPGGLALLIFVTSDIASGATVTAMTRSMEPTVIPTLAPLPNLVTVPVPDSSLDSPAAPNSSIPPG
jgi:outer membrane protein assembly factor BamB